MTVDYLCRHSAKLEHLIVLEELCCSISLIFLATSDFVSVAGSWH